MADGSRIPRVAIEPSALRSLPLGAADGFVLSRIDGRATERELASLTGLPEAQIRSSLDKLASLKVIDFGGAPAPSPPRRPSGSMSVASMPPMSTSAPSDRNAQLGVGIPPSPPSDTKIAEKAAGSGSPTGASNALLLAAIARIPDDSPELAEDVELPPELRRRIMGLYSVVASLDHYALLALGRDADKKAVKRSYFELAALFHPDRYFRKSLGTFKSKMELIFAKVSTAYETLADKERRAEYDLYLGDIEKSRDVESMLRNVMSEVESAERTAMDLAAGMPSFVPPAVVPPAPESRPESSTPPSSVHGSGAYSAVVPRGPSVRPQSPASVVPAAVNAAPPPRAPSPVADQMRKEALAMRLRGIARPVAKPPVEVAAPASAAPRAAPGDGGDALRRRYDERVEASRRHQGEKYVKIGEDAESRNDLTAASAAYRVALTFLREEDAAYAHARDVIAKSELALGETYMRQADHEERANRWEDAVRSWGRAAKLRQNDHRVQERYANALVKSRGDLHEAARCAQRAVQLAPTMGDYHCTLASVHIAAGLHLNARRELEAAALQFPDNLNIQAFLRKLP